MKAQKRMLVMALVLFLMGCSDEGPETQVATLSAVEAVKVTGELQSASSRFFGPPSLADTWNFTISYMAPDGAVVGPDKPILRFDTQELKTKLRDKNNSLNEKQKELEKSRIVAEEQIAELSLQVEQAKADLDKARLKAEIPETLLALRDFRENQLLLEMAELQLALKKEELAKEKLIQDTEIQILEREVGVLKVEAASYEGSIDSMTIMSPGEGVVIHVRDRRNNKMAVGDSTWRGRRVIEFPDLSKLEAKIEIPERDSARVAVGQTVRFTMDAVPDREFYGEIVELASVIRLRSINQPDKVFDATVQLRNPDTELMRPGMNINAEILVGDQVLEAGF